MTKLTNIGLLTLIGSCAVVACSDDDDDGGAHGGGRAGASQAGTTSGGNAGEGGDPGGDAGAPNTGGTTATGGTLVVAGADQGGADQGGSGGAAGDAGAGGAAGAGPLATLSDAQILLVLDTLNRGEVEEAYAALPRLTSADVKTFAQEMVTDHSSARQSVLATADELELAPTPSEPQAELQGESEAHVAMLRATPDAALDETYVNLQVVAHEEALALLDDLADAADAAEITTLISTLRASVALHYQHAQELQDML